MKETNRKMAQKIADEYEKGFQDKSGLANSAPCNCDGARPIDR
jgi:hypothetical protein